MIGRMHNYKSLSDCQQHGDGLHHTVQAVAHMHNRPRIMARGLPLLS
jgi:hypothetical protein